VWEMDFSAEEFERFEVVAGDLLVCEGGEVGRAAIWRGQVPAVCYQKALHRVRPRAGIAPELLLYLFMRLSQTNAFEPFVTGSTIKHLPQEDLRELPFPLPPLNEQRRIVAAIEEQFSRLDAADESLRLAKRRLAALRRAAVAQVLHGSWPESDLGELALRITKGTTPTSHGRPFTSDGVLYVKAESLVNGRVDHTRCAHVDAETDAMLSRSRLEEHDVLVTIAGTLGRVAVVMAHDLPANTNQAVSVVRLKDTELTPWVMTWLQGPRAQGLLVTGGRGVGLQNLNLRQVGAIPVPLPPLEEQGRIVAEVEQRVTVIDGMRDAIKQAKRRSAALRRSILERAFRGGLVPQDPSDEPASVLLERIAAERAGAEEANSRRPRRRATMETS
jgi:type I restriction enzyme, S subunit